MTKFYWHIHHNVLLEPATESIENRIAYIKEGKPAHEIETRLRLVKPVKGTLPKAIVEAGETSSKARETYVKARDASHKVLRAYKKAEEASDKTWEACDNSDKARIAAYEADWKMWKTLKTHKTEIEALHRKECPNCPWDGETIFPTE